MRNYIVILCCLFSAIIISPAIANAQKNINSVYSNPRADSLFKIAIAKEGAHKFQVAIKIYKKILHIKPNDPLAMNSIAGLYGKKRSFKKEINWSKKAIKSNSTYYPAYINYGNALALMGQMKKAASMYEKAIKLQPNNPLGYYSMGVLAERLHGLKLAIRFYKKSVSVDPKFANGYYNLGAMYANAGKFGKAIAALKKVLKLEPGAKDAKRMIKRIKKDRSKNANQ